MTILLVALNGNSQSSNTQNNQEKKEVPKLPLIRYSNNDGKYGFKDQSGKIIVPAIYDATGNFSEGLAAVIRNNKYAYINTTGKIVIPWLPYYDAAEFTDGLAMVRIWNENTGFKYGFINKQGKEVIPVAFDYASGFSDGLAFAEKDKEKFFITTSGAIAFKRKKGVEYWGCEEGLVLFKENGRCGFLDKKGNIAIPATYFQAGVFTNGLSPVGDSLHHGAINKNGKIIIPFIFDRVVIERNHPILVCVKDRVGFVDKQGNMIMPMVFEKGYTYGNQFASAEKDFEGYKIFPENGIIKARLVKKNNGHEPIPEQANSNNITDEQDGYFVPSYPLFSETLAPVVRNGMIGFINKEKKLVVPFKYKYAQSFSGGLAAVSDGKKWGFIDETGKLVIQMKYDKVLRFQANITGVWEGNHYITIDKTGERYE